LLVYFATLLRATPPSGGVVPLFDEVAQMSAGCAAQFEAMPRHPQALINDPELRSSTSRCPGSIRSAGATAVIWVAIAGAPSFSSHVLSDAASLQPRCLRAAGWLPAAN
jgi:hypothetical protein